MYLLLLPPFSVKLINLRLGLASKLDLKLSWKRTPLFNNVKCQSMLLFNSSLLNYTLWTWWSVMLLCIVPTSHAGDEWKLINRCNLEMHHMYVLRLQFSLLWRRVSGWKLLTYQRQHRLAPQQAFAQSVRMWLYMYSSMLMLLCFCTRQACTHKKVDPVRKHRMPETCKSRLSRD